MEAKFYWILWTYAADYSTLMKIEASSAQDAFHKATWFYQKDAAFMKTANIYIFDHPPVSYRQDENENLGALGGEV